MTNHPIDEAAEREAFKTWSRSQPIEDLIASVHNGTLGPNVWLARARIAADELASLRAEVEKYRGGIHTHGPECWSWGWRHYECAEREIARLRARVAELEREMDEARAAAEKEFDNVMALSAECEAYRADAERYRWLRAKVSIIDKAGFMSGDRYAAFEILDMPFPTYVAPRPDIEFDRAIDAAIAQRAGETG